MPFAYVEVPAGRVHGPVGLAVEAKRKIGRMGSGCVVRREPFGPVWASQNHHSGDAFVFVAGWCERTCLERKQPDLDPHAIARPEFAGNVNA
jgi:hypothetical protein